MHLQFIHAHSGERMSSLPVIRRWRFVTILVVGLAGLIHLSLMREHFEEQFIYGLVFTALALFQFTLALLLGWRPGPCVYRAGIWGSGIVVLIYVLTRLIPLPGASGPEEVDLLGIAATSLEIAAVVLLAVALPEPEMTSPVAWSAALVGARWSGDLCAPLAHPDRCGAMDECRLSIAPHLGRNRFLVGAHADPGGGAAAPCLVGRSLVEPARCVRARCPGWPQPRRLYPPAACRVHESQRASGEVAGAPARGVGRSGVL